MEMENVILTWLAQELPSKRRGGGENDASAKVLLSSRHRHKEIMKGSKRKAPHYLCVGRCLQDKAEQMG